MIRDVARKIAMGPDLAEAFAGPLALARRVKDQRQRERGRKVSSLHAPEVACLGQGKAISPTSSASRGASRPRSGAAGAGRSGHPCRRCPALLMTGPRGPA